MSYAGSIICIIPEFHLGGNTGAQSQLWPKVRGSSSGWQDIEIWLLSLVHYKTDDQSNSLGTHDCSGYDKWTCKSIKCAQPPFPIIIISKNQSLTQVYSWSYLEIICPLKKMFVNKYYQNNSMEKLHLNWEVLKVKYLYTL